MPDMPAVLLTEDRQITLADHPVPTRRADQVIVDVDLCGICGSDLHAPGLPQVYVGGVVMGHEAAGTISWVGDEVEGWTLGQRVAINPNGNVDDTCAQCRAGRPNFCRQATMETALGLQLDGGLAAQMAAFPGTLRPVPDSMTRIASAWVEPTATALHAINLAGELEDRTVVVTGGGPIGQLAVRIARSRGAGRLVLVEPSPERRAFGVASGADEIVTPAEAADLIGDLHAHVVVEASGSGAASALGLEVLAPGGVFVVVGAGEGNVLDSGPVLLKELQVRGSFVYTREFDDAISLLAGGCIDVDDLTSVVAPLEEYRNAFDSLLDASTMKVLISPRG